MTKGYISYKEKSLVLKRNFHLMISYDSKKLIFFFKNLIKVGNPFLEPSSVKGYKDPDSQYKIF